MELLERIWKLISPVKSVFGLYLLMYSLPSALLLTVALGAYESMIVESRLNGPVAVLVGVCCAALFAWTVFFLTYFTKQRNSNPDLYQRGFMSEYTVGDNTNE